MSQESKPKEFWIGPNLDAYNSTKNVQETDLIHVIEYCAYESLIESLNLAKKQRDEFNMERDDARAEVKRLKYQGADYWKAQYNELKQNIIKSDLGFDVETNSATGWMVKYTRQLDENKNLTTLLTEQLRMFAERSIELTEARAELADEKQALSVLRSANKQNLEQLAEARAEVERLKANQLGSFDVAVPSDKWYDTEKLLTETAAALEANVSTLSGMILYRGENVKQLDGTVKWELVPTYLKGYLDASQTMLTKLKSHMAGGGE